MSTHFGPDYLEKVYAGWLGKIIGVRYGAPIEMWTSEAIREFYGELDGYVKTYRDFAADDDTNGPLFFIRALEDLAQDGTLTPQQVGSTVLNYVSNGYGFFWWGGYGISAEHTLYENLTCGIQAPQSGSARQNGIVVAEQIGGQIFIDSWGLVFPGDYRKAADYAKIAASVGWDENGIYGGMFVAACISAAFEDRNMERILQKALSVIPQDCQYACMVRDVMAFYQAHPEDWHGCLAFIKANYWSDRYQGWCHIIPNAAIIVLAMLYGQGDFTRTLNIGNMCGFDTDCNVGNLGTILGVANGLAGIDYNKWRAPIQDFQVCSSVVGSLNITDAASSALYLARLAYQTAGEPLPEKLRQLTEAPRHYHFELPGSTQSVRAEILPGGNDEHLLSLLNTDEAAFTGERSLKVMATPFAPAGKRKHCEQLKVFVKTYYAKEDFSDGRYTPTFSPILYPGQRVSAQLMACKGFHHLKASIFVKDFHTGQLHLSEPQVLSDERWTALDYEIPAGADWCIKEVGVLVTRTPEELAAPEADRIGIYLDDLKWDGMADYRVDFRKETNWAWEDKPIKTQLSQFTKNKGIWEIESGALRGHCSNWGETYTGDVGWKNYLLKTSLTPVSGGWHGVSFRAQGAARSYALCLLEGDRLAVLKKEDNSYSILKEVPFPWVHDHTYAFTIEVRENQIRVFAGETCCLELQDNHRPYLHGMVGFALREGSQCFYNTLEIQPVSERSL